MVDKVVKQCVEDLRRLYGSELRAGSLELNCDGYYTVNITVDYSTKVFKEASKILNGEEEEKKELLAYLQDKYHSLRKEADSFKKSADEFAKQSEILMKQAASIEYQLLNTRP